MKQLEVEGAVLRYWDFDAVVKNDTGEVIARGDWVRKPTKVVATQVETEADIIDNIAVDEAKHIMLVNLGLMELAKQASGTVPAGCFPKSWVKSVVASLKGSPKFKAMKSAERNISVMRYLGEKPAVRAGFEAALTENPPAGEDSEDEE